MKTTLTQLTLAVLLALGLSACGGGSETMAADAASTLAAGAGTGASTGPRAKALSAALAAPAAATAAVDATEAARQLMDFAEVTFPGYFPPHPATLSAEPFSFRYYPDTGAYLGVVTAAGTPYVHNGIYVMGGPFGAAPVLVGQVTDFITPVANYSLALSADRTPVQQGSTATLKATLTRQNGFTGPVQLVLDGLPAGVTSNVITIPAGSSTADIRLSAQTSAPHSLPTVARLRAVNGSDVLHQAVTVTVRGAPGDIDTSFGGGVNITPVGYEDYANAAAVQADGKVIVAGSSTMPTGTFVSLVRYRRDGGLDTSFGTDGKVVTQVGTRSDAAAAIAVQPDGKIVIAGASDQLTSGLDFLVLRYNADGSLDAGFGSGGKVTTAMSGDTDRAWAVAIQADGKIVVAGESNSGSTSGIDFALARYNSNGTLDAGFGSGGKVITPLKSNTGRDSIYALALATVAGEQRILAVGGDGDFQAARYLPDGSLDAGFGNGGKVMALFTSSIGGARGVTLLPGGQAVLAGAINNDFAAAQLTANGTLDTAFGNGGKFVQGVVPTNWDSATAVVRQADGKLVLGGWAYSGNSSAGDFAALRLLPNGTLDASFGTGGIVIHPTAAGTKGDQAHGLVLQADERVPTVRAIQAGEANGSNHDFSLIRLWL
ncbi:MAG TPA: hypothetical protein VLK61_27295 [Aquabacterium sp.]|nr:hypothetical protein [Aquabacterium sp.]